MPNRFCGVCLEPTFQTSNQLWWHVNDNVEKYCMNLKEDADKIVYINNFVIEIFPLLSITRHPV